MLALNTEASVTLMSPKLDPSGFIHDFFMRSVNHRRSSGSTTHTTSNHEIILGHSFMSCSQTKCPWETRFLTCQNIEEIALPNDESSGEPELQVLRPSVKYLQTSEFQAYYVASITFRLFNSVGVGLFFL